MKSLLFLPLLLLTVVFTSCKKETINEIVPNRTITTPVAFEDWHQDTPDGNYYVDIQMPEIDQRVWNTNGVLTYVSFDGVNFEAIPDVFFGSTIVVTHKVGSIRLQVEGADGSLANPPDDFTLKIVIVESDPA